jgi:predicted RNA binding protein with dsRBD fold (UPF0201 family)
VTEVRATARCFPTEDRSKVAEAILNIFPDAVIEGDDPLVGIGRSTEQFSEILLKSRIRSAARAVLMRSITDTSVRFLLNKQVATVGKVSFSEEAHPLGDIEVVMISEDIQSVVDEIAPPRTRAAAKVSE